MIFTLNLNDLNFEFRWWIDGKNVRTYLKNNSHSYSNANGFHNWIQGPGHIAFGPWAPMSNSSDDIYWVGSPPDFDTLPGHAFSAHLDSLQVICLKDLNSSSVSDSSVENKIKKIDLEVGKKIVKEGGEVDEKEVDEESQSSRFHPWDSYVPSLILFSVLLTL